MSYYTIIPILSPSPPPSTPFPPPTPPVDEVVISYLFDTVYTVFFVKFLKFKFTKKSPPPPPFLPFLPQVMTNMIGTNEWATCFVVNDVDLPTGYYFGVTAATGDLAG